MYLFHKDCNGWALDVLLHGVWICSETFLDSALAINLHNN